MTRENAISAILDYFREHEDEFINAIEELDNWNGYLGDNRYYEMEYLNEFYHDSDPIDILQRAFFGYCEDYTDEHGNHTEAFNPNQDYFSFNGYGNLVSTDYIDYSAELDEYFVEEYIDNNNHMYDVPEEVQEIIDSIGNDDEEEDLKYSA